MGSSEMKLIASRVKEITAPPETVWAIISDIKNAANIISGIKNIETLEDSAGPSLVGTKWKETREWMGREAIETMWITESCEPLFYETRAESHGSIYQSRLNLEPQPNCTSLTMQFSCQPVTLGAKVMWLLTGWLAKSSLQKLIDQDLEDIKIASENS